MTGPTVPDGAAIRLVLVDDHPVVREGLEAYLGLHDDIEVVGQAASLADARALVPALAPDVVLLDLHLPDGSGLELLCEDVGDSRLVVLTSLLDDDLVRRAVRLGAAGFLYKHAGPQALVDGVRAAHRGELPLDPTAARALAAPRRDPLDELTPREREVLDLVARGRRNREIADALYISEKTVKTHMTAVLSKLGVTDRTQAALRARDLGVGGG